jgi:hypothetical protein
MLFDINAQRWKMLADSVTGDNINWSNDSQSVYVDSLREKNSIVERIQIKDGQRRSVVDLANLERGAGMTDGWIGLHPDNLPILLRLSTTSEVYALAWTNRP